MSSPRRVALRRQASVVSLLLLAAVGAASAQTVRPDTARDGAIGTWTLVDERGATVGLKLTAPFTELFTAAAQSIVRGTWTSGGRSGGWAIRATK